jgi:hypothetical protein
VSRAEQLGHSGREASLSATGALNSYSPFIAPSSAFDKGLIMSNLPRLRSTPNQSILCNRRLWAHLLLVLILFGSPQLAHADPDQQASVQVYRTANFQVNYRTENDPGACGPDDGDFEAWSTEAQVAMNLVVDILDDLLNSAVPIVIDACFQRVDPEGGTLAFAGATTNLTQAEAPALPVANRTYPIALANAIAGIDHNGAEVELVATANAEVAWDYCTTGCNVAADRSDFVSTMVHEVLHGLGFLTSFDQSQDDPNSGAYSEPPAVIDDYVIRVADGVKLLDLPNHSAELLAAMQQGSGTVALNAPNTVAINGGVAPFLYTPNPFSQGSSMSHWDDDHPTNLGRMMNSATGDGPSSRVVDAITLMTLKDIGWSVNDAADFSSSALSAYGVAQHINNPTFVHYMVLGIAFSTEAAPVANDPSDDGVTKLPGWTVGANGGQITVVVSANQPSARGCLSGWIDWNGDGVFGGPGEQIAAMLPVTVGNQLVPFEIPQEVAEGVVNNARIRLMPDWDGDGLCDDQAPLAPAGGVFGGEVEDYQWAVGAIPGEPAPRAQTLVLTVVIR